MKTVILKMYDEHQDNEREIILGECDNAYECCNILNAFFIGVNPSISTHNRVFVDDIEIVGYAEYELIFDYIYQWYETAHTLGIMKIELVLQFLTEFGTNRLLQKGVFNK